MDIFSKLSEHAAEGVTAHVRSVTDLSCFENRSLDVIFASNLFEHLTHDELLEALEEIRRVLAVGGRLIVMQPNFKLCYKTYFDDYTHLQIFTDQGMYDLFEMAGLQVVDVQSRFMPVNMKSTLKLKLPCLDLIVRFYLMLPWRPLAGQMLVVAENNYTDD